MVLFINTTIPNNYDSIRGTVNDEDTIFVADTIINGLCLCYCEESISYDVVMNFYNSLGEIISTVTDTIAQDSNEFILDRTKADVDYANSLSEVQRANLATDLKGTLNLSDFQRLDTNFSALSILDDEEFLDLTPQDVPYEAYFNTIEANLIDVLETDYHLASTPAVPERPFNEYRKWNSIEQIVFDNFDIRTTRFKYFSDLTTLPIRSGGYENIAISYANAVFKSVPSKLLQVPLIKLSGGGIINRLNEIAAKVGTAEPVSDTIRIVDGETSTRIVDGTSDVRKVDE